MTDMYLEALNELDEIRAEAAEAERDAAVYRRVLAAQDRGHHNGLAQGKREGLAAADRALRIGVDKLLLRHMETSDELALHMRAFEKLRDHFKSKYQDNMKLESRSGYSLSEDRDVETFQLRMQPWVFTYQYVLPR